VKLAAAEAEADKAAKVARRGDASADVQEQGDTLLQEVRTKAAQAKKNAALLVALLDVSVPRETRQFERTESGQVAVIAELCVDDQFAAAFRRWDPDLDIDRTPLEEVSKRLRSQPPPLVQEVVAGLDAWMLQRRQQKGKAGDWQRLLRLANALDAN